MSQPDYEDDLVFPPQEDFVDLSENLTEKWKQNKLCYGKNYWCCGDDGKAEICTLGTDNKFYSGVYEVEGIEEVLSICDYEEIQELRSKNKHLSDLLDNVCAEKENRLMPIYNVGDLYEDKGVVAAVTFEDGKVKVLVLALKDTFEEEKNWDEAMKHFEGSEWKLPTKEECGLIIANLDKVQKALKEYGKEMNGWYWSSSEYDINNAWILRPCIGASTGGLGIFYDKDYYNYVRPVLALSI